MRPCRTLALLAVVFALLSGLAPAEEKPKDGKDRELHVVGLYEGYTKSNGVIHGDRAQVMVKRPGKKVTLVLLAYKPMTWEVAVSKETTIEKVVLGGSGRAAVKGLPEGVEVVEAFRGSKNSKLPFYAYSPESPNFRAIVEALDEMTGQKLASFSGFYRANAESAIAVEDVTDDERFSADYPRPVPAADLPKLTFQAHFLTPGKMPHEVTRSFGEFTLAGATKDTLKPLPDHVSRVAYDPAGKRYYGIYRHSLAAIDMDKRKATVIETSLDVPEISWPADVTYDTKRERVLLSTFGGGGYLYAYYPKTAKWEALAEKPAQVVAYHPKNDTLYGLKCDFRGKTELQEINAKGAVITSTALAGQFLPGMLGDGTSGALQLIPAEDKLVLLISPIGMRGGEVPAAKWSYIYLIDPKTGKAQLVRKEKVGGK